ncbi:MAG: GtrA family protein [Rhodoglobus sp.]
MRRLIDDQRVTFLVVGGINTVAGFAFFALFHWLIGSVVGNIGSLLAAHVVTSCLGFVLYRRFVFRVDGPIVPDFVRFQSVYLLPLAGNVVALPILVEAAGWNVLVAQAVIVVVSTVVSFVGHKYFSFSRRNPAAHSPEELAGGRSRDTPVYRSLIALTVVAWGAALVTPDSLMWDDWVTSNSDTVRMYADLGLPWMGYIAKVLWAIGPWSFTLLTLISTVATGAAVFAISGRGLGLHHAERWLLAALVVALPLNAARSHVAVLSTYALSLAVFAAGWLVLVSWKGATGPSIARVVSASLLFFASFTTASLLPFVALPVAHLAWLALRRDQPLWRAMFGFGLTYWYLLATPVTFWVVRTLFLKPSGLYGGYNLFVSFGSPLSSSARAALLVGALLAVALVALGLVACRERAARGLQVALGIATALAGVGFAIIRESASPVNLVVPVLIVACGFLLAITARPRTSLSAGSAGVVPVLALGLVVLTLGSLPYVLVNKLPSFQLWETRHQLLLPFGVAVVVVATARALGGFDGGRIRTLIASSLVTALALTSLTIGLTLVADWNKQSQIIAALKSEPLVRAAHTVVFDDRTKSLNFEGRTALFYEYTGWLGAAFGDETRLGLDRTAVPSYLDGSLDRVRPYASRYGFGAFKPSTTGVLVTISQSPGSTWWGLLFDADTIDVGVEQVGDLESLR